jgi:hypothetical protein
MKTIQVSDEAKKRIERIKKEGFRFIHSNPPVIMLLQIGIYLCLQS